ncbi:MAG: Wadjet anti-phage system protein JetD domain-containing protein [Lutisporaceae bacterium]
MEYKALLNKLNNYKGIRISEKKVREMSEVKDYEEYYQLMVSLIENKVINPVKDSGPNGMNPTLYKRYNVIKEQEDYDALIFDIRLLHPILNIEGYLLQPAKYMSHKKWIEPLNTFLITKNEYLDTTVSINERSFQIFYQEKALKDDKELAGILNFNKEIRDYLNFYITPEPFFDHNIFSDSYLKQDIINVLIIENKDTWYTLRKIMDSKTNELCGIQFHILLYGEGKKINRKSSSLTEYDEIILNTRISKYYYFGDLDYEGINIFNDLILNNPTLDIKLMTPLYCEMLLMSEKVDLPITKDLQNKKAIERFLSCFDIGYQERVLYILNSRRYIPQEILSYRDFIKYFNEKREVYV